MHIKYKTTSLKGFAHTDLIEVFFLYLLVSLFVTLVLADFCGKEFKIALNTSVNSERF